MSCSHAGCSWSTKQGSVLIFKMVEEAKTQQEFRNLVRIIDRDVDGNMPLFLALTKVRGVGFMMSNAICRALALNRAEKIGNVAVTVITNIEDCMRNPAKYGVPSWMFNRKKDYATGESLHYVSSDLKLRKDLDIRALKLMRCYRGVRHAKGSKKVRGQSTRSTGRKGTSMGVVKKKQQPTAAPKKQPAKEGKK